MWTLNFSWVIEGKLAGHICACTNFTKVVNAVTGGV
jgi:aerobic-type carbon monoxide dehydrogenase small subunit (CoxS/CutS family)